MSPLPGSGGGRARSPCEAQRPTDDRRTGPRRGCLLPSVRQRARLVEISADFEQARVTLIAAARSAAALQPSTQLLLADDGESGAEPLVLDNRALRDLAQLVEGAVGQIAALDAEINRRSKADPTARRLMTIPGVGPIVSTAITALVPAAEGFRAGRDFAAWLGLTPVQKSTGGKQKLGAVSKRGERTIRRLLIIGASAVVRQASRRGAPEGSWLARMLARKPRMLVTVALANKMARIVWALLVKGGVYRAPVAAA